MHLIQLDSRLSWDMPEHFSSLPGAQNVTHSALFDPQTLFPYQFVWFELIAFRFIEVIMDPSTSSIGVYHKINAKTNRMRHPKFSLYPIIFKKLS